MNLSSKAFHSLRKILSAPVQKVQHRASSKTNVMFDRLQRVNDGNRLGNSLLMNGFWRSGTTISQDIFSEVLKAKSYFEPFEPGRVGQSRYIFDFARAHGLDANDRSFVSVLMPHIGKEGDHDDGLLQYLDSIILGGFSHPGLVRNRKSAGEGLRQAKCVKFVRAHFMLRDLWEHYHIPIVHIRRHPFSVIASAIRVDGWNQNGFNKMDIHRLLKLNLPFIRETNLTLFERTVRFPKNLRRIENIAAYWCISEIIADQTIMQLDGPSKVIQFESLMACRSDAIDELFQHLNLSRENAISSSHFTRMSKTSHGDSHGRDYDPSMSYKAVLKAEDISCITDVCDYFGVSIDAIEEDIRKQNLFSHSLTTTKQSAKL